MIDKCSTCGKTLGQPSESNLQFGMSIPPSFIRIQVMETTYNQHLQLETKVKKTVECCNLCTLDALKNVLIGNSESTNYKFEKYLEKAQLIDSA